MPSDESVLYACQAITDQAKTMLFQANLHTARQDFEKYL